MKTRVSILIICLFVFNSCNIVKSLKAFYIPEAVVFQEAFVGDWVDKKNVPWKVISFREAYEEESKKEKMAEEDVQLFEKHKDGYFVQYGDEDSESVFIAIPFTIDDTIFIDFIPFDFKIFHTSGSLIKQHLLKTHSVAKFDVLEDKKIKVTWLDEDRLETLLKSHKIQIKHETIGFDEDLLLTASSEELYRFLKKYNASTIEDKWKSDEEITLSPANATP